ncbi:MAG: TetR family transcriptional regulator C-terminal domain-containing protein, partial [Eubacterium sp.]|nr:TetR family transcriptional regulator C-terminal domain-containing protein [Eubacterium sp.]
LFKTAILHSGTLRLDSNYKKLFDDIFSPILMRFNIPENERPYMMAFYINGITALVMEWLKNDCNESVEDISNLIIRNIKSSTSY